MADTKVTYTDTTLRAQVLAVDKSLADSVIKDAYEFSNGRKFEEKTPAEYTVPVVP